MESTTDDLLYLQTYHNANIDNRNQHEQRTPSPSSSSSSSTHMDDHDNEANMDPFYSSLFSAPPDFQAELEMDLFPDAESLDAFSQLQQEEQRLREELIFSSANLNINRFLDVDHNSPLSSGTDVDSPFQIEFNNESLSSHSPSSMFMMQNENSTSSASSSVDIDLNAGTNEFPNTFVDTFTLSPSMDSPPLTPPEIKLDISTYGQPNILFSATNLGSNVLSVNNTNLPKLIPALKSNKRGRSASHDDSPDVQALKRHIRMIRNRESASLSRKKKKEYVTGLEDKIKDLEKENEVLKKENVFLRSKLQQGVTKIGSSSDKKKGQIGVVAKVALLGLFGFVMINFNTNPRPLQPQEHSNLSEFSRTLTKLRLSESGSGDDVPPLMAHRRRFVPRSEDVDFNYTRTILDVEAQHLDGNYDSKTNISNIHNNVVNTPFPYPNSTITKPTSYLNGTAYNQTQLNTISKSNAQVHHMSNATSANLDSNSAMRQMKRERERSNSSRWRSRGITSNKKKISGGWSGSSLKSENLVFPPFMGSAGVTNSSNPQQTSNRCPNHFNKTESMRVKSDLEDIFGKGKFSRKKQNAKISPVVKMEPIVYSLISHNMDAAAIIPRRETLELNKGLTVYNGEKKKFSTILEKLERREDTFYVVSLASDNQLLLSAKASNESSRPKMTLLLPWRNETLNEDMILQIDCEVFQVFNLNDEKTKPKRQRRSG